MDFVEVAVEVRVDGTFTYAVPDRLKPTLQVGHRVLVPFGRRKITGYVIADTGAPDGYEAKDVVELLDESSIVPEELVGFFRWVSEYYTHPLGDVIRTALPPGINVHTERRIRITDAGRVAIEDGSTPEEERDALERLVARPDGEGRTGGRRPLIPGRIADRLVSRGWASAGVGLRQSRVRARETTFVAPAEVGLEEALETTRRAPAQSALLRWLFARGEVTLEELRAAFPGAGALSKKLAERGLVRLIRRPMDRLPGGDRFPTDTRAHAPTPDQATALAALEQTLEGGFAAFLLDGVTGSGKTEVYLRLIEAARAAGKGALVLVPEIALTPQLVGRFRARFGRDVAVLHSGLSAGERRDEWWRIRRGDASVAVGVRSAVFAPVRKLGVVVVDEEHDGSFKQEDGLRYHARDLALVRARDAGATVVLGSATPSLESVHNANTGRYTRLVLPRRIEDRPLPKVEIVDLRDHPAPRDEKWILSPPLVVALRETVRAGRQAILFLNRRGHTPTLLCTQCGAVEQCPNCEVSLTLHQQPPRMLCHYCGHEMPPAQSCSGCGGELRAIGVGTQSVEAEVNARIDGARVVRLDRDTTTKKGSLARILADFALGRSDVLVGTQMVAKGHDFPGVTLIGIVLADLALHVPDFRAAERTLALVSQVAGRAGRGDDPGRVFVQSFRPEHPAIAGAVGHGWSNFATAELAARRAGRWPPFCRLLLLRLDGTHPGQVERAARQVAGMCERAAVDNPDADLEVLGPAPAPLGRLRGRTRWQVLVKAPHPKAVRWIAGYLKDTALPSGVQLVLDIDPVGMM